MKKLIDSKFCRMWRVNRAKYYRWKKNFDKSISSKIRKFSSLLLEILSMILGMIKLQSKGFGKSDFDLKSYRFSRVKYY
jgi:hypothetical protein